MEREGQGWGRRRGDAKPYQLSKLLSSPTQQISTPLHHSHPSIHSSYPPHLPQPSSNDPREEKEAASHRRP